MKMRPKMMKSSFQLLKSTAPSSPMKKSNGIHQTNSRRSEHEPGDAYHPSDATDGSLTLSYFSSTSRSRYCYCEIIGKRRRQERCKLEEILRGRDRTVSFATTNEYFEGEYGLSV